MLAELLGSEPRPWQPREALLSYPSSKGPLNREVIEKDGKQGPMQYGHNVKRDKEVLEFTKSIF